MLFCKSIYFLLFGFKFVFLEKVRNEIFPILIDFFIFQIIFMFQILIQFKIVWTFNILLFLYTIFTHVIFILYPQLLYNYIYNQCVLFVFYIECIDHYNKNRNLLPSFLSICVNKQLPIEQTKIYLNDECIICLNVIPSENHYKIQGCSCKYTYHKICITEWLKYDSKCPICSIQV